MAKFLVEILFSATGEPQVRGTYESIGASAKSSSDAVETASLKSEASLRRVTEAATRLQEQMQDTKKSSGLIADMTSLNSKIQEQITALRSGGDAYTAWTQKQKDAALAQQILTAQVKAGVSAHSDAGKSIAAQITLNSQLKNELGTLTQAQVGATGQMIEFGQGAERVGAVIGEMVTKLVALAAVVGAGLSFNKILDDTVASQDAMAQLAAGVKATGDKTGETVPKLLALASSLEETTKYSRTTIEQAESLGLTFTHISAQAFPAFMKAAADIAARTGEDLPSAVEKLGRALDTGLVQSLKRAGITFDATQQAQAKYLAETGQYSKEIALVLGAVEGKLSGSAEAARNTLGGALQVLRNRFEDVAIEIGTDMSPALVQMTKDFEAATKTTDFKLLEQEIGSGLVTAIQATSGTVQFLLEHMEGLKEVIVGIIALKFASVIADIASALRGLVVAETAAAAPLTAILIAISGVTMAMRQYIVEQGRLSLEMQKQLGVESQAHSSLMEMQGATDKVTQALKDRAQAAGSALVAELALAQADLEHAKQTAGQKIFYPAGPERDAAIASNQDVQDQQGRVSALKIQVKQLGDEYIRVSGLQVISDKQKEDVHHLQGQVSQLTATLQAYADKIADLTRKQSQQLSAQEYLSEALDHGLLIYNQAVIQQQRAAAITAALTQVYTAHRAEIEKLTTEYKKLSDSKKPGSDDEAAKVKAAIDAENKAYSDQAAQIGINAGKIFDATEAKNIQLKTDQEIKTLTDQLNTAIAQLSDTTNRNAVASRQVAESQAHEKDVLSLLSPETQRHLADLRFLIQLNKDATDSQKILNASFDETTKIRAQVADWEQQRAAVIAYGFEVANILKQYGLLSTATQQLAIDEKVLAYVQAGHSQAEGEQLRQALEGQQKVINGLHLMQAQIEINEKTYKAFADQLAQNLAGLFGNFVKGTEITLDDFKKAIQDTFATILQKMIQDWLTQWFEAMAQWLARWVATQAAAKAVQAGLGTSGTGPVADAGQYGQLLSGGSTGGFGSLIGSAGTAGVSGSGSGIAGLFSGTGAAGAAGSIVAWVGALYVFAKLVNSLNAHMQATGESVINFGKALDITSPKADSHIQALEANGKAIAEQIQQFFVALGGVFGSLDSTVGIKRRGQGSNTEWKVYANGIVTSFGKDAQAAFDFATIEAIKNSSAIGLDPLVVAAIKDYAGQNLQEFQTEIQFAERIATQNLPGISGQLASAASQYFSDLHQAQVQFAGDLASLNSAVASIAQKFSDTVQSLKNSALGIDTSTSDFLAGIVGFQATMAAKASEIASQLQKQIQDTEAQIAQMGKGPRPGLVNGDGGNDPNTDQADWNARLAQLKQNVQQYKDELAKIPKALSDTEVNMAVFDSLYKYLQGSQKYAAQAAEYAKMKVEIEFESIKLQLIALGKWEQFAGMWQDALNAAEKAAVTQARARPSSSSGTSPADQRATLRDQIAAMVAAAAGAVHTSFLDLTNQILAFTKSAKDAKLPASELAQAVDLMTKKFQADLLVQAQGYAGIGTQFTAQLKTVTDFFHELEALGRAKTGMPNWLEAILKGDALKQLGTQLTDSINQFNGLVDPMVAINQQADTLRQNIIAYGQAVGLTADQIKALLDKVNSGVEYQRQGAINGIMDTLFGYLKSDSAYAQQAADLKKKEVDLQFALIEAQLKALSAWDDETQKIFDASKKAAEDAATGVAQAAAFNYAQAVAQDRANVNAAGDAAVQAWRSAIQQFTQQTQAVATNPTLSGLTSGQQYTTAQQNFNDLLAKARAGDTSALSQLDQARQTDLTLARSQFGGGQGYLEEYQRVMAASADLLTTAQQTEARVFADAMAAQTQTQTSALTTAIYDSANQVAAAIRAGFAGIPHYAEGGITIRPHLALVGERGPEAIVPLSRPMIYPSFGARILPFSRQDTTGSAASGSNQDVVLAVGRLAEAQSRMAADIRSIAESSAKTARSNDGMMRTERIRQTIAKRK